MRTQVGIIGAGPAGLMLARLLHLAGIESIIIENRSRDYIENRIRAGLIEHWAADLLTELGVGARMQARGHAALGHQYRHQRRPAPHRLQGAGRQARHHLRPAGGGEGPGRAAPRRRRADVVRGRRRQRARLDRRSGRRSGSRHEGKAQEIDCDFIAGCDGFHGICRPSIPDGVLSTCSSATIRSAGSAFCRRARRPTTS